MSIHALYRFFDEAGDLLYVGITMNPAARWKQHSLDKNWWTEVANITVEPHADRKSVLEAERLAIVTERPLYNTMHNRLPKPVEQERIRWQCAGCHEAIDDEDGYLAIDESELREYQDLKREWDATYNEGTSWKAKSLEFYLSHPSEASWMAWHPECDPTGDDGYGYAISVTRIRTHKQMLSWTAHLMEKTWLGDTDWVKLIQRVLSPEMQETK